MFWHNAGCTQLSRLTDASSLQPTISKRTEPPSTALQTSYAGVAPTDFASSYNSGSQSGPCSGYLGAGSRGMWSGY